MRRIGGDMPIMAPNAPLSRNWRRKASFSMIWCNVFKSCSSFCAAKVNAASPAISEMRRLTLEFPSKMRAGVEGDVVRLTLEVDDFGTITPTAQIDDNVIVGDTFTIRPGNVKA